jgi:predicted DNA-binding protein with PD1-like motif
MHNMNAKTSAITFPGLRLRPGQDLKGELDAYAIAHRLQAACVLTCVGSLRRAVLRFADQERAVILNDKFEIVSLTGVMSAYGSHYHIAIADGEGRTLGAHLMEGCQVYTTAEITLAELADMYFLRTLDAETGYEELDIQENHHWPLDS